MAKRKVEDHISLIGTMSSCDKSLAFGFDLLMAGPGHEPVKLSSRCDQHQSFVRHAIFVCRFVHFRCLNPSMGDKLRPAF